MSRLGEQSGTKGAREAGRKRGREGSSHSLILSSRGISHSEFKDQNPGEHAYPGRTSHQPQVVEMHEPHIRSYQASAIFGFHYRQQMPL